MKEDLQKRSADVLDASIFFCFGIWEVFVSHWLTTWKQDKHLLRWCATHWALSLYSTEGNSQWKGERKQGRHAAKGRGRTKSAAAFRHNKYITSYLCLLCNASVKASKKRIGESSEVHVWNRLSTSISSWGYVPVLPSLLFYTSSDQRGPTVSQNARVPTGSICSSSDLHQAGCINSCYTSASQEAAARCCTQPLVAYLQTGPRYVQFFKFWEACEVSKRSLWDRVIWMRKRITDQLFNKTYQLITGLNLMVVVFVLPLYGRC